MTHRVAPYANDWMKHRARSLRRESPIPERILWGLLRGRRLAGWKFRRQQPVGPYVADFLCDEAKLVVELDGMTHVGQGARDDARTRFMEAQGLTVIRFSNDDLLQHQEAVALAILQAVETKLARPSTNGDRKP